MVALKYLLIVGGLGMILVVAGILAYDLYREMLYRRALAVTGAGSVEPSPQLRWRTSLALALLAWGPLLVAFSIVVVPSGMAGVRISQMSGTLPGTLLSRCAFRYTAGGGCRAVRYPRSGLQHRHFGKC